MNNSPIAVWNMAKSSGGSVVCSNVMIFDCLYLWPI